MQVVAKKKINKRVVRGTGWTQKCKNKPMRVTRQLIAQRKPLTSKLGTCARAKIAQIAQILGPIYVKGSTLLGQLFVRDQVIDGELTNS